MEKQSERDLEQALHSIWVNAANTRKRTAGKRIDTILDNSRAELSLRELLMFFIYLGQAFFMLGGAVIQAVVQNPSTTENEAD